MAAVRLRCHPCVPMRLEPPSACPPVPVGLTFRRLVELGLKAKAGK